MRSIIDPYPIVKGFLVFSHEKYLELKLVLDIYLGNTGLGSGFPSRLFSHMALVLKCLQILFSLFPPAHASKRMSSLMTTLPVIKHVRTKHLTASRTQLVLSHYTA